MLRTVKTLDTNTAAKYAVGNCRGKGADFMRNLLFPDGQPTSFEEYVKQLRI